MNIPNQLAPNRLINWRVWLPSRGNVLFTLLALGCFYYAMRVGAISPTTAPATSTSTIAYQGRLADATGNPLTGTYDMTFRLYNVATGGTDLWTESWTGVQVNEGLFNVLLGSQSTISSSIMADNATLWLGIAVGSDSEMIPRIQLGSAPFAVQALTVPDDSITTAKIKDGAITQTKAPTLLQGSGINERIERGTGMWSGAWAQNPAAETWYRESYITFSIPFSTPPEVFVIVSSGDPEAWAVVGDITTQGFNTRNVAVVEIPNTNPDTFTWIAIGK